MSLSFRSTQVSAPTTPPTLSIGGTGFYIRHRRVNLDGGVSLWSEASEFSGASVTITPESYSDSTQLLRDEFLYSEDDITYYIIPRSGTLTGAQTVTTFTPLLWVEAVNEDSQNSALTDLNFGTFTTSSSPFKRLYVFNDGLSVGSLTFNFIDAITTEVAVNYSGLIQVEIEGVFSQYSQAPSTLYNDSFLWQAPPNNLNTLGLVLPSNSFVQVKVTLLNFPLGGLVENTISLSMQVQENLRVFPLSYDSNWALNTFLYDPSKGFDYPFLYTEDAGATLVLKPFLININGVLVGRFTETRFTVDPNFFQTITISNNGALQVWEESETIPDNLLQIVNILPIFSVIDYYVSPKPDTHISATLDPSLANSFITYNTLTEEYELSPTNAEIWGLALTETTYATSGIVLVKEGIGDILKGVTLSCIDGLAVQDVNGVLIALQDAIYGKVLCQFRIFNPSTGVVDFSEALPVGLISGGELSINAGDPAKFNLSAGTGRITDFYSDPLNPIVYEVSWLAYTAQTVTNIATSTVTHVYVDNTGAIFQSTVIPTETLRRQYILIGQLGHTNNTTIGAVVPTPDIAASPISQLRDYADAVGIVNIGNTLSPNGANLNINKTLGYLYKLGANFYTDPLSPTQLTIAAGTAFTFRYRTQTGNGSTVSAIDPNNYDVGGVITSVPVGKVTNQRVFLGLNGNVVIQYGQVLYNSISAAITGIQTDSSTFIQFPNLTENFILIGIITVAQGSTNLSSDTQARFFKTSKFGEASASIAGSSVSTLQQAYENSSVDPEILTNSTGGAVALRRGSAADTDNIFVGENGAGTVTFSINGNGALLNTKLSQLAATTSAELATVISDETGSGALVFASSPTLTGTPLSPTATIGTNTTQIATTAFVNQAYRYLGTQIFTTGTAAAYTPTAGTRLIRVKVFGATGGGGGSDGQGAGTVAIGGSGGNGGYTEKNFATSGQTFTYTIGSAGVGGAAGANNGTAGGTTSFAASVDGTIQVTGGGGGSGFLGVENGISQQATGGVGSGGSFNMSGSVAITARWVSGAVYVFASNGSPLFGFGTSATSEGNGTNAGGLGAGGLGASSFTLPNYVGGNGFRGEIHIEEYA